MPTINDYSTFAFMLQGYNPADQAQRAGSTTVRYYGFVDRFGAWYIQEETSSNNNLDYAWRYDKGNDGYAAAWTARESGTYQAFDIKYK